MHNKCVSDKISEGYYKNTVPYSKENRAAYNDMDAIMLARFKEDMARECGVDTNPKTPLLFEKAWCLGHSSGFSEVWNYYLELVDLIRPCPMPARGAQEPREEGFTHMEKEA